MINGDISNETPPRIIVLMDVVAKSHLEEKGMIVKVPHRTSIVPNNVVLSHLWNIADKYGLSVELAAYKDESWTQKDLDSFMERLERRGANPFNYAELYSDINDFISDLPYRPNLKGVVDLQSRVARYGSWGIELDNL